MSNQSAAVISLQGRAWAKDAEGNLRELKVGDVLAADEQLVTETNTQITLDFGGGETASLAGAHTVSMSPDLWPETAASEAQASVLEEQFDSILASLEQNDELLQQSQFDNIYASLEANDALLGASPFDVILSALEVNDQLLQDSQFEAIYSSLVANEALLRESDFSTIYNYLAENDALLLDARMDDLFASLQANEQALLAGDGDLLDMLNEAPAAGGQASEGGSSFVRLPRISETVSDPDLSFANPRAAQSAAVQEGDVPVNEGPAVAAQSFTTAEDTPFNGQIESSDPDSATLSYQLVGAPLNGDVTINTQTGEFTYTPFADYNGADSFTVIVSDGESSAEQTISVQVTPVNDAPTATDLSLATAEDIPVSGQVDASDIDLPEGDTLSYSLAEAPENGAVNLNAQTGEFTYTPNENYSGEDSFTVLVTDSSGATAESVVEVDVNPVNDAPQAVDDGPLQTVHNGVTLGNALENDFDIDSSQLTATGFVVAGDATQYAAGEVAAIDGVGSFTLADNGDFTFTPSANYSGPVPEVTYTVTDGEATDSAVIRFANVPEADGGVTPPPPPPAEAEASISLDSVTADNLIDANEAAQTIVISGSVSGDAREGDQITLTIGANTYTGTVGAGSTFAINVAGSVLATNNSISASVSGQTEAGASYTASTTANYAVDTQSQALITLDPITGDNIVNMEEAAGTPVITGVVGADAGPGDTVTLSVNGTTYTGLVAGDNTFSIEVAGADLAADNQLSAQVTGTDSNGNAFIATDTESYQVDTTAPVAEITIDAIGDSNAVAMAAAQGQTTQISGTVGGDVQDGDTVTITIAGNEYTGLVENGAFNIDVSAQDLIDDSDSSISGSVTTFDAAGNSASANDEEAYSLDPVTVVQFTDNFVNGVAYQTSSGLSGYTGDAGSPGSFFVRPEDTITFTIGDVTVAQFSADVIQGTVLFLQDIAEVELANSNDNYVENMAIFLQALDNDLTDATPDNGVLNTGSLTNTDASYNSNINIDASLHDLFSGYIDPTTDAPLNIATAGKEMISQALAHAGVEFTRDTERDPSDNNVFETIAMEHVADTIDQLAGDRGPVTTDERTPDVLDVPGGQIKYNYNELNGEITFTTDDLLEGAVGRQVITENLLVKNVSLSAGYEDIGTLEDRGDGNYAIVLNDGVDQYDLEGLAIDYRVEDWTAFEEVTSSTQDQYRSHLSAEIPDVNEGDGFNQFTLNSELTFDTDQTLLINFTSELLSAQLGYPVAEYADDYIVPIEYSNDGGQTWQTMEQHSIDYSMSLPRPIFSFTLAAGSDSVDIRVPIFDDAAIEPTEYFDAYVSGDNVYYEHLQFAIFDNDTESSDLPQISIDFVVTVEGSGNAVFTVSLDRPSTETVTVDYATADLAAVAGLDYESVSGTLTFNPGQTSATISVPIIDDDIVESNPNPELALINLSNATNAVLSDSQGTLRIFDNDSPNTTDIGLDIDPITGDNLVNAAEAGQTIAVTGTVSAADNINFAIVILNINGQSYQTTTDGSGTYSINVPGSELSSDADTTVEGYVYGFGANGAQATGAAVEVYSVDLSGPGVAIIDGNGSEAGEQSVQEASGDSVSGSAVVSAVAGISQVTINDQDISSASIDSPVFINGNYGQLAVTNYDSGTGAITYTYTENGAVRDHSAGADSVVDQFSIIVTDAANSVATDVLDILITDTQPQTADDSNTVELGGSAVGNVITGGGADQLGAEGGELHSVSFGGVKFDTDSAEFNGTEWTIVGDSGVLTIDTQGNYTYSSTAAAPDATSVGGGDAGSWSGVALYGFDGASDSYLDVNGLLDPATLDAAHSANVVYASEQVGVRIGSGDISTIDSRDNGGAESQALVIDFGVNATQANVQFGQIGSSDDGRWIAYGEDFNQVGSGTFDLMPYSLHINPGSEFQYLAISGADTDDHFTLHSVDYVEASANPADDVFSYELIDADGSISNASDLTIQHTITAADGDEAISIGEDDNIAAGEFNLLDNATPASNSNVVTGTGDEAVLINGIDQTDLFTISATAMEFGEAEFTITHKETGNVGVFTINSNGNLTLQNGAASLFNFLGAGDVASITLEYTVNGNIQSVATINVSGENDAPVAVNDNVTVAEDSGATVIDVLANDTDVEGDLLSVTAVTQPSNGTVALVNGEVRYTPDANFTGQDTFTYTVSDGNGGTDTGTVTVTVDPENDPPVAVNDNVTVSEDSGATVIDVLVNDTDVEGDLLSVTAVTQPSNGTVALVNGEVRYTPDANFTGQDTFTYTVSDGNGGTDTGTVTVTVDPENDPPVAVNDNVTVSEDSGATVIDVLANDTDVEADLLSVTAVTQPSNGTVALVNGEVRYTPDANFTGQDTFTYTVSDGNGGTDTGTVTVTVDPENDPPVAVNDNVTVAEDSGATVIDVLANDTDVEGDLLSVTAVTQPSNGTVALVNGEVRYTPDANFTGQDTFTYTVSDGNGGTDTGTVTVTVDPENDPPVAVNDNVTVSEDSGATVIDVLANDSDVEGDLLSVTAVTQPSNGTVALVNGEVRYTPDANFTGQDTFTYTVSDGNGGTDTGTVTVTVDPENDPPVAVNDNVTVSEDSGATVIDVLANDTDVEADLLSVTAVTQPSNGTVALVNGEVRYTPDANFTGQDTFTYTVSDGNGGTDTGTVTVTVDPENDPPVAVNDNVTVSEDSGATRP
ncbi:Ig-like domain-containing protein [Gilvimarinus sp. DA14]|uniref:Ig-like domain-containing protein n=1 Tax=Gilvimarinus sp. DA14 TaxID=2956798 RepID=UPI0020B69DB3|nr:Ig-like domain-containing protein [Gilvimarinus sp. DA14]UTF61349.1 Ig-like domain-containing protein [Gilvimarinus sp. DA14]